MLFILERSSEANRRNLFNPMWVPLWLFSPERLRSAVDAGWSRDKASFSWWRVCFWTLLVQMGAPVSLFIPFVLYGKFLLAVTLGVRTSSSFCTPTGQVFANLSVKQWPLSFSFLSSPVTSLTLRLCQCPGSSSSSACVGWCALCLLDCCYWALPGVVARGITSPATGPTAWFYRAAAVHIPIGWPTTSFSYCAFVPDACLEDIYTYNIHM